MRKSVLAAVGLVGLAVAVLAVAFHRPVAPPPPAQKTETAPPAVAPPQSAPAAETPAATPGEPPAPALPPKLASDLPTVDVPDRPIHTVPEDEPVIPKVTLLDRKGNEIASRRMVLTAPRAVPLPTRPAIFTGSAQATGGVALAVAGRPVHLFGVRVADPRDRCGLGPGDSRSCTEVARDALAQRLKRYPTVSCHMPAGQRGEPAAVCIDASGTDLGGFLVAEGFALADTNQSYEYFGSEGVARSFRRGLWHNR